VRDFLYLDVDRIKSYVAQAEGGLLEVYDKLSRQDRGLEAGAGAEGEVGGLLRLLGRVGAHGELGANFLISRGDKESRSLHDAIYDRLEERLDGTQAITSIDGHIPREEWYTMLGDGRIAPACFLRVTAPIRFWDFERMYALMDNWEPLTEAIADAAAAAELQKCEQRLSELSNGKRKVEEKRITRAAQQQIGGEDVKKMVDSLSVIIKGFYGTPFVMRVLPVSDDPSVRLVCRLDTEWLRDPKDVILFKYGDAPPTPWTVLCQVADVPPEDYRPQALEGVFTNQLIDAISQMFGALMAFEDFGITVRYPEIPVTPLAVYRDTGQ